MGPKKTMVCVCENCGNEAEMTIKCEEMVAEGQPAKGPPQPPQVKRTIVCNRCGNEAEMLVEYK
jgi:thymidine kinase